MKKMKIYRAEGEYILSLLRFQNEELGKIIENREYHLEEDISESQLCNIHQQIEQCKFTMAQNSALIEKFDEAVNPE